MKTIRIIGYMVAMGALGLLYLLVAGIDALTQRDEQGDA